MSRYKKQEFSKARIRKGWRILLRFLLVLWILTVSEVLLLKFFNPPFTVKTAWTWFGNRLFASQDKSPLYHWRPLKEISPHLRRAVLAGEDQRFLLHRGFDFIEINKAVSEMVMEKGARGASTITMQVARTVFLWSGRSWLRKSLEAYYTLLIEMFWSKKRILEIYLNTVDWGTGIMGAETASRRYFHMPSSRVTVSQAALLAAILPNPHEWSPVNPSPYVKERKYKIMQDMPKMPLL